MTDKVCKDFLGTEIRVGDLVIAERLSYREFAICEVIKITDKMVFLETVDTEHNFKQYHNMIIKHPGRHHELPRNPRQLEPLTLDELKQRIGKPIWIPCKGYEVLKAVEGVKLIFTNPFLTGNYGDAPLYPREPEGEQHG